MLLLRKPSKHMRAFIIGMSGYVKHGTRVFDAF
jgi:hypothetical protein